MSKKLENIDIEVNELKGKNLPTWEVVIPNRKSIGLIEKVEGRYRATTSKTSNILFANKHITIIIPHCLTLIFFIHAPYSLG